ncbi:MAG: alpha-amylase family glycosyl hydrolase, partial [Candidatus Competibacteraceae bacterium]|nr:alpha-amylase family glycosyl hydrolase [Candidatus Competibacteraceae bacterium]
MPLRLAGLLALPLLLWLPLAVALEPLYPRLASGEAQEIARPALRHPVTDEVLYFLIPDRFADGLDANDCGAFAGQCLEGAPQEQVLEHGFLPSDRGYYHGGDLRGLLQRLDYLARLGITALWVGPIFENKPVQQDITNLYGHSSAYHGYWITDFMHVDPHLGTDEDFKALVEAAHERDIQVFMDIITNHTADVIKYAGGEYGYRTKDNFPYRTADGEPFNDAEYAYYGQEDYEFPPLDLESFPYTPMVPEAEQGSKNPAWLNDPLLYHNRGDTSFTGENSLYGDFFGLDDLFTERKEVVEGMLDIYRHWVETYGPDGFRIDTTKHVNMEFWQLFGPEIVAAAADSGAPHFFAFGEVYNTQPLFLSEFSTRGRLQSTIDFAFQEAARNFASRSNPTDELRAFFAADDYYLDADSNAYAMPTFLGNHDMGRIGYFLQREDQPEADDGELLARSRLAHALMFFSRGQPVIYYGDEQGFVGDGGDKLARQNMFESQVAEYNDDDLIGTDATTAEVNFDPQHPLYRDLARFARLYHDHPALRRGAQIHRHSEDRAGIYAFSRIDREEQLEYLVVLNNAEELRSVTLPTFYGEGVAFKPLLAEEEGAPTTGEQGRLEVRVPPLGVVVYRAAQPLPPSQQAPAISLTAPATGETVTLLEQSIDGVRVIQPLEVRAELVGEGPVEVSFAVSVDGGPWQYLGTDDHPPYRVFYRVYETPP